MHRSCFSTMTLFIYIAMTTSSVYGEIQITLECRENFSLQTVARRSKPHIGDGDYLVSVCCPVSHTEAVFFGREGVGCCSVKGERCIFTCKCKDNTYPVKSESPVISTKEIIRKRPRPHIPNVFASDSLSLLHDIET